MIRKIRLRVEIREEIAALATLFHAHDQCDQSVAPLLSKKERTQIKRTRELFAERLEAVKAPFRDVVKRLSSVREVALSFQWQDTPSAVLEVLQFREFQIEFDLHELFLENDEEAIELFFLVSAVTNEQHLFDTHVVLGGRRSQPVYLLALLYHYARKFGYLEDDVEEEDGFFEDANDAGADDEDGLSEVARFFLHYASLEWPCSAQELRKAYKQAVYQSHPDRNPQDRNALARTQLLNVGYSELLVACEADAAA